MLTAFAILVAIHFAVDYQFQSDFVAINKNRHLNKTPFPWFYVMASHCACHVQLDLLHARLRLAYEKAGVRP